MVFERNQNISVLYMQKPWLKINYKITKCFGIAHVKLNHTYKWIVEKNKVSVGEITRKCGFMNRKYKADLVNI